MLTHTVLVLYRSDKFICGIPKYLFIWYMTSSLAVVITFNVVTIIYHIITDNLLSSTGHCIIDVVDHGYMINLVLVVYVVLCNSVQICQYMILLFYFYKFSANEGAVLQSKTQKQLYKITTDIGSSVGISYMCWILLKFTGHNVVGATVHLIFFAMQQCVISAVFVLQLRQQKYSKM